MTDVPKPQDPCLATEKRGMLSVDEALGRIRTALVPITGFECLALRNALGRVLAEEITSPLDVPGYDNSGMDGYAVRAADLPEEGEVTLTVVGTAFAGQPFQGELRPGQAVRIMTGAVIPGGADTVIMQEAAVREGETVRLGAGHKRGENVRRAGEDMARGEVVLSPGKRLNPVELGLLASLGVPEVKVSRRLRVAIFSTGDELRSLGQPLGEGQIYDSNRYTLHGLLSRLGTEIIDMGVIPDQREAISGAFTMASQVADVLITSGGVSVGEADYVKETLEALGQVDFWKIAMKPGKPLAFGRVSDAVFFGLPGNPVSVMATFYQVVQPSLRHLMGQSVTEALRITVRTAERLKKSPGRQDFQRGILERGADGEWVVHSAGRQGSHVLSGVSRANCFIVLPAEWGDVEAGTLVEVQPFEGLV